MSVKPTTLIGPKLQMVAESVNSEFAAILQRLNSKEWGPEFDRCFEIDDTGVISFLPKGKEGATEKGGFAEVNRQSGKTGRVLKKLPIEWDNDQEIEKLSHEIASFFAEPNIEIVSGKDIRKYYSGSMYAEGGTLGSSCMRHSKCQSYFGLYEKNSQVAMAILKKDGPKIYARALLWKLDSGDTFMDRIYYTSDKEMHIMMRWAKSKGFLHKESQNSNAEFNFVYPDGSVKKGFAKVTLDTTDFSEWPYCDTLQYVSIEAKTISNTRNVRRLTSQSGGFSE